MKKVTVEIKGMEFELPVFEASTPSGKYVKGAVRESMKKQVVGEKLHGWIEQNDGSFTLPLAVDKETNNVISARIEFSISMKQDFEGKKTAAKKDEANVPSLFD